MLWLILGVDVPRNINPRMTEVGRYLLHENAVTSHPRRSRMPEVVDCEVLKPRILRRPFEGFLWSAPVKWSSLNVSALSAFGLSGRWIVAPAVCIQGNCVA